MNRVAVGVDIVEVDEVESALHHFGERYLNRVFTDHELACATGAGEARARQLAACFAAKEAVIKALAGSDGDGPPSWRSIEVRGEADGECSLHLSGRAAVLARRAQLGEFALSLNLQGALASAVVLAIANDSQ